MLIRFKSVVALQKTTIGNAVAHEITSATVIRELQMYSSTVCPNGGYKWSACAENVAAGQTTVDAVMTAWMVSSGHRANILNVKYTMFGCGYAYKSGTTYKHYWIQDFANGATESCS
ncbi:Uncharacterized protein P3T76_000698 [Phytophthora citrophthora]|uniref:SCP domain-containing protein n=1 Tax=Phytophthora citrophthora TaxID=4793 RepID=A0AAD9H133_9STRA|nr:Uncharacterized protein P3T76_000698 [Phytophthora citrophthora]